MKLLDRLDVNFPLDVNKELRSTKDNLFNPQRPQEKHASYCSLKLGCFSHGLPNLHFFLR